MGRGGGGDNQQSVYEGEEEGGVKKYEVIG
jgi:hypothetical protein